MLQDLPLRKMTYLDVRTSQEAEKTPILDALNIPLEELGERTFELPSKAIPIRLVGARAHEGAAFLQSRGRRVVIESEWTNGPSGPGRLWDPNPWLLANCQSEPPGKALDIACGSGREAVALALLGWDVTAVDRLPDALEKGRLLAQRCEVNMTWQTLDLRRDELPEGQFDLITCFFWWNQSLMQKAVQRLTPGGQLVVETFSPEHRKRYGKPTNPDLVLDPLLAKQVFPGAGVEEAEYDGRCVCRLQMRNAPEA